MNRYISFFLRECLVFSIVVYVCWTLSIYMDDKIDSLYKEHPTHVNRASGVSGVFIKDRGSVLISKSLNNKENILVMASSELGTMPPYNINFLMPNRYYDGCVSAVGQAYVQNFHHAMNLGANYESVKDNNVVVMEGFQWFTGKEPNIQGFFSNFSQQQFYEFLNNDKLSKKNKWYLCNRYIYMEDIYKKKDITSSINIKRLSERLPKVASFLKLLFENGIFDGIAEFPTTYLLAKIYASDNIFDRGLYFATMPYYFFRGHIMNLKDKFDSLMWLYKVQNKKETDVMKFADWDDLYAGGEKEGERACTNNGIYVYDEYYTKHLGPRWEKLKDLQAQTKVMDSTEWEDYRFLLEVCHELGIKPYIVLESTNGWYYDYIGLTRDKREKAYIRQESIAKEYSVSYLALKDKEYEPYFYCDIMHLGWKGWSYVTENVVTHFTKRKAK